MTVCRHISLSAVSKERQYLHPCDEYERSEEGGGTSSLGERPLLTLQSEEIRVQGGGRAEQMDTVDVA